MHQLLTKLNWFENPQKNHIVEFYPSDDILVRYIRQYIITGLNINETCIIIGEKAHTDYVKKQLEEKGFDTVKLAEAKKLLFLDARQTLDSFMINGMPDKDLFLKNVGKLIKEIASSGRQVRAFGSMVSLLWQDNNPDAVIQLENYWNELAEIVSFSLFCAYPSESFDSSDSKMVKAINHCHAMAI